MDTGLAVKNRERKMILFLPVKLQELFVKVFKKAVFHRFFLFIF